MSLKVEERKRKKRERERRESVYLIINKTENGKLN
jgi:hypothetical protein